MNFLNFDNLLSLFWITLAFGTLLLEYLTVNVASSWVPKFAKSLLLFGKFGEESVILDGPRGLEAPYERYFLTGLFTALTNIVKALEVPKRWFLHFYVYLLFSIVWVGVIAAVDAETQFTRANITLWAFVLVQAARRIYECSYVSIYSDNTMNFVHYATGFAFYTSLCYATLNSFFIEIPDSSVSSSFSPSLASLNFLKTIILLSIFVSASFFQYQSHYILASLRTEGSKMNNNNKGNKESEDVENEEEDKKDNNKEANEGVRKRKQVVDKPKSIEKSISNQYYLPTEGLFSLVLCPHYLCEIVVYTCMLPLTDCSLLWLSLYTFVVINQIVASLLAYRWYRVKFGDRLPHNVKAIIPFLL